MRNFKARLKKLEAKKPPVKRIVRIYWADGTFVGEMSYYLYAEIYHPYILKSAIPNQPRLKNKFAPTSDDLISNSERGSNSNVA